MGKYNYDKTALKGLGVGDFLGEVKLRSSMIEKGENTIPTSIYNPNVLAAKLHPSVQFAVISEVKEYGGAKSFVLDADKEMGTEKLAFFRAGQYVSVAFEIDGVRICKPYSISCGPEKALKNGQYMLTVKETPNGFVSDYIMKNWKAGTKIIMSGPLGQFYYMGLRDAAHVVALAGGSGITPFASMAAAVADGTEDFKLTILYGSKTRDNIVMKDFLDECEAKSGGRVKVVHVLSDDDAEGFEHGFITAELIKKYAGSGDYSVFICGPKAMYAFERGEVEKLGLPKRRIRFEVPGEYGSPAADADYPKEAAGKEFKLTVWIRGNSREVVCKSEESLLNAMERAGISVPSDCRSGQCGWCHSRLIKGEVYIPSSNDGRRAGDKKFGWVHPCSTYALSDIELEIFPII